MPSRAEQYRRLPGLTAANTAIERDRKEKQELLGKPCKIVDDGKNLWVEHGNTFQKTALTSPKARKGAAGAGGLPKGASGPHCAC